jgi:hypothetical protein
MALLVFSAALKKIIFYARDRPNMDTITPRFQNE